MTLNVKITKTGGADLQARIRAVDHGVPKVREVAVLRADGESVEAYVTNTSSLKITEEPLEVVATANETEPETVAKVPPNLPTDTGAASYPDVPSDTDAKADSVIGEIAGGEAGQGEQAAKGEQAAAS
jgi:hypothetical protein